jgi:hypothetical protein
MHPADGACCEADADCSPVLGWEWAVGDERRRCPGGGGVRLLLSEPVITELNAKCHVAAQRRLTS